METTAIAATTPTISSAPVLGLLSPVPPLEPDPEPSIPNLGTLDIAENETIIFEMWQVYGLTIRHLYLPIETCETPDFKL